MSHLTKSCLSSVTVVIGVLSAEVMICPVAFEKLQRMKLGGLDHVQCTVEIKPYRWSTKLRSGGTCLGENKCRCDGENKDVSFLMDARMEQFIWNTLGKRKAAHILLG